MDNQNKNQEQEKIVAYTVEGELLTKRAYNKRLEKGSKEIEEGDYITHEDFKKEIKNWSKKKK